jgi:hypothetical protein
MEPTAQFSTHVTRTVVISYKQAPYLPIAVLKMKYSETSINRFRRGILKKNDGYGRTIGAGACIKQKNAVFWDVRKFGFCGSYKSHTA